MIETLAYLCCVLCFAAFSSKLIELRHSQPSRRLWYLSGFGVCIAGGILLLTPATEAALGYTEPWISLLNLGGDQLKIGAMAFAVAFGRSMRLGDQQRRSWHSLVVVLVLAAETVLYFASDTTRSGEDTVAGPGGLPYFFAYNVVFLAYGLFSQGLFAFVFGRFARHATPGPLRTGLWFIVAGAMAGLAWTFWDIDDLRILAETGRVKAGEDTVSAILAASLVLLVVAGATLSLWGPRLSRPVRSWRAYRRYRRLEPLWEALCAAVPGIALYPGGRLPGGAEVVLYRRVIEVRDGQLALRPYFDPELPEWAEAEARRSGVPEAQIPATVEAAAIAAAMAASRAGRRYSAEGTSPQTAYFREGDVEAEAAWLVEVTRAWRTSPVVESVATR